MNMLPTLITSMADLASNTTQVLASAGDGPVAVVVDSRPAFYVLSPQAMQALVWGGWSHAAATGSPDIGAAPIARQQHAALQADALFGVLAQPVQVATWSASGERGHGVASDMAARSAVSSVLTGAVTEKKQAQTGGKKRAKGAVFAATRDGGAVGRAALDQFHLQADFEALADDLVAFERRRVARGELAPASVAIMRQRLDLNILPVLKKVRPDAVDGNTLDDVVDRLGAAGLSPTTISQYMVVVRKLLKMAVRRGLLLEMPEFPKVHTKNKPRAMFSVSEYRLLISTARRLSADRRSAPQTKVEGGTRERFWVPTKYLQLPPDMAWVIAFMVNSFVRPSDIRQLRNKHVEVVRGEHTYLRLNLPESKRHDRPIVTMRPAVRVFERALTHAQSQGHGAPDDYVFLPQLRDRQHALSILGFWFKWVLREAGMEEIDHLGRKRTLYSLRHTAIMYRLLYGQGIDTLTLARNARTSVQMIERFYASSLTGEMNVGMLQSKRGARGSK
jgi:integrase